MALANETSTKLLHHHPENAHLDASPPALPPRLRPASPPPPRARWSPGGLTGIPRPGGTRSGSPWLILPSRVPFQAPPPLAAGRPQLSPDSQGLRKPSRGQLSNPEEFTHLQSRLGSEQDASASGQWLLQGLRWRASVSAGTSVRSGRPWLCACRVSVAWPGRVCL